MQLPLRVEAIVGSDEGNGCRSVGRTAGAGGEHQKAWQEHSVPHGNLLQASAEGFPRSVRYGAALRGGEEEKIPELVGGVGIEPTTPAV